MNWSSFAVEHLKDYEAKREAISNISENIATLEAKFTSIRSAATDGIPTGDNSNHREEMLIGNIAYRQELAENLKIVKREVALTEKALAKLDKKEFMILELFFIRRPCDYINRLCDELFISQSELYRKKDDALKHFTRIYYGIVEL